MGNFFQEKNFNCSNIDNDEMINCDIQIGYTTHSYHKTIFLVFSSIGVIFGIIFFIDYIIYKVKKAKLNKNKNSGSMKLFFRFLSILDFITSLYWFLSSLFLSTVQDIKENTLCKSLSVIYVILFIFNFYLILTIIIALGAFFLGVLGKSPMNTCFINTELNPLSAIIYGIGLIFIIIIFYQIIHGLYFSKMFINNTIMRSLYVQNSVYALIFCCLHIPMLVLFILTTIKNRNITQSEKALQLFVYLSTILLYLTPSLLSGLRIYQGMMKLNCLKKRKGKNKISLNKILDSDSDLSLTVGDEYDWLDKHAIESFMKNILLGIAICIKKSKDIKIPPQLTKDFFTDSIKFEVNLKNYRLYGIDSFDSKSNDNINVNIIDYAPACFAYLRTLEDINIDDMVNSFLPNNNKEGMKKSAGKNH